MIAGLVFFITFDLFSLYKHCLHLPDWTNVQYYSELAWSFLHGRSDLPELPTAVDLSPYHGRVYAYFPPLNALLMIPLIWLRGGIVHFPQRLFAMFFGALNGALFYLIFTRLKMKSACPHRWLPFASALIFSLGTSNLVFSVVGNHWFVGQLTAVTFVLLAFWTALERRLAWRPAMTVVSSCALGLAVAGREHFLLLLPFWTALILSDETYQLPGQGSYGRRLWRAACDPQHRIRVLKVWGPSLFVFFGLLIYNHARFGSWSENGSTYQHMEPWVRADVDRYGLFNIRYIFRNIYFTLLRLPGMQHWDHRSITMGLSLFFQCPILLLLFRRGGPAWSDLSQGLIIVTLLISAVLLCFVGTGENQFGARYYFDVLPLMGALIFLREKESTNHRLFLWLGGCSVLINLAGVLVYLPWHR